MNENNFHNQVKVIFHLLLLLFCLITLVLFGTYLYVITNNNKHEVLNIPEVFVTNTPSDEIVNGIHVRTGLIEGDGLMEVIHNCTSCHSSKLITQNRMSKEMWLGTIQWMQATQNLQDLGENEKVIVNYLTTHYAPQEKGRREPLTNIEWYELDN